MVFDWFSEELYGFCGNQLNTSTMDIQIRINTCMQAYPIHWQPYITKYTQEVKAILERNNNFGHRIIWAYRDDDGKERKDPGAYLSVVTHPVLGVYFNYSAVEFLRNWEKEFSKNK